MYRFISIDPGKGRLSTIGVTCWNRDPQPVFIENLNKEEFGALLDSLEGKTEGMAEIIYEEYVVNPAIPHGGKKVETIQVIGQIKDFARRNKVPCVGQPASILGIAEKWSGVKMPKKHSTSHRISAFLHGYYRLTQQGILKPRVLDKK